jgi:hypothetical protein
MRLRTLSQTRIGVLDRRYSSVHYPSSGDSGPRSADDWVGRGSLDDDDFMLPVVMALEMASPGLATSRFGQVLREAISAEEAGERPIYLGVSAGCSTG